MANILSLSNVQRRFKVTYDRANVNYFVVHRPDGSRRVFSHTGKGLYTSQVAYPKVTRTDVMILCTVEGNKQAYTRHQVKMAEAARRLQIYNGQTKRPTAWLHHLWKVAEELPSDRRRHRHLPCAILHRARFPEREDCPKKELTCRSHVVRNFVRANAKTQGGHHMLRHHVSKRAAPPSLNSSGHQVLHSRGDCKSP